MPEYHVVVVPREQVTEMCELPWKELLARASPTASEGVRLLKTGTLQFLSRPVRPAGLDNIAHPDPRFTDWVECSVLAEGYDQWKGKTVLRQQNWSAKK